MNPTREEILEAECENLQTENELLRANIGALTALREADKAEVERLKTEASALRAIVANDRIDLDAAEARAEAAERERDSFRMRIDAADLRLDQLRDERDALLATLHRAQDQAGKHLHVEYERDEKAQDLMLWQAKAEDLKVSRDDLQARLDGLRAPRTRVIKDGGDYTFEGEVITRFMKRDGVTERVVVEDDRGCVHIFSPKQIREVK